MSYKKLLEAISCADIDEVKKLLARGTKPAKVRGVPTEDPSALAEALRSGASEIAELLLAHGADVNEAGEPTALIAAISGYGDLDREAWVERLLELGADPNQVAEGMTPLCHALDQSQPGLARRLLALGVSLAPASDDAHSAFSLACRTKDSEFCLLLIARGVDPNAPSPASDHLPLAEALSSQLWEVAEALLARGADPKLCNQYSAPLEGAIDGGSVPWVQRLVGLGVDRGWRSRGRFTYVEVAAQGAKAEVVRALHTLGLGPTDNGIQAFICCVISNDHPDTLAALFEGGASPSQVDLTHILDIAILNHRVASVRFLLPHLADPNASTDDAWRSPSGDAGPPQCSLLGRAILEAQPAIMRLLLDAGADPQRPLPFDTLTERRGTKIAGGTSPSDLAVLKKKALLRAREDTSGIDEVIAILPAPTAAKKRPKAPTKPKVAGPEYKHDIDAELGRLASAGGCDVEALQEALDGVDEKGGAWAYFQRAMVAARDILIEDKVMALLSSSALRRFLLDDPFDGEGPPEILEDEGEVDEDDEPVNRVFLTYFPGESHAALRKGDIFAASGADIYVAQPLRPRHFTAGATRSSVSVSVIDASHADFPTSAFADASAQTSPPSKSVSPKPYASAAAGPHTTSSPSAVTRGATQAETVLVSLQPT